MGRTFVRGLISALTVGHDEFKVCEDEHMVVLVMENVRNVKYMIDKRVRDEKVQ